MYWNAHILKADYSNLKIQIYVPLHITKVYYSFPPRVRNKDGGE